MQNNLSNRLNKLEKEVEKMLNPYFDEGIVIWVNIDKGETVEGKIAEEEKKLGRKINRNKAMIVRVSGLSRWRI
jgi:hypothetical protein